MPGALGDNDGRDDDDDDNDGEVFTIGVMPDTQYLTDSSNRVERLKDMVKDGMSTLKVLD